MQKVTRLYSCDAGARLHEILQVTLFGTLQKNLSVLDFSLLLPDVMTIADEVDSQLTQVMESYMGVAQKPCAAA